MIMRHTQYAMKKQKVWLLFLIPVIIPLVVTIMTRNKSCSSQVEVYIGVQPAGVQSWKASLQRLSQEVQRCPRAEKIIVRYKVPLGPGVLAHAASSFRRSTRTTIYYRQEHQIRADRYSEGSNFVFTKVTDSAINSVAAQNGSFDDLVKLGCEDNSP